VQFGKLRLRAILALLVLTTSVPLGLFAGILIVRSSHEQRALVEQRNVETARAVSVAVDQHVESARAALQALAATDLLTTPQRITFNEAALRLVPTQPGWYAVLLVHPSGAVMADTALGDNDIPSFTTADWVQRVVTTKLPTVSNLFQDSTAGGHFFVVAVPLSFVDFGGPMMLAWVLTSFNDMFIHSPIRPHYGPLRHILVDNRYHRVHHSIETRHFDKNFGIMFTIWDRLFGTASFPKRDEWPAVGVESLAPPRTIADYILRPRPEWRSPYRSRK